MAKPISFGQFKFGTKKACKEDARRRIKEIGTPAALSTA